jgi:hypothetical protein
MAKYKVYLGVAKEEIVKKLPRNLVPILPFGSIGQEKVNLVVFPSIRDKVVTSGHISAFMTKIENLRPLVVLGGYFTLEAAKALREKVDYFYCIDEGFWTDESYNDIRVSISKRNG